MRLTEDPGRVEPRQWIDSTIVDWDGRTYRPASTNVSSGKSSGRGFFGRTEIVNPDRIRLVFEVPKSAVLRTVTVPEPISLSERPVRLYDSSGTPRPLRRVEPDYPEAARRRGIAGLVKLEVLVQPDGSVAGARQVHGPSILGEAAAAAVRQWKFQPHVVGGKPVPAVITVSIDFRAGHPLTKTFAR